MSRALVLGGGGVLGVAWEAALLAGLADGAVDVRTADLVIGTSAGSMVGARIAAGDDLREPKASVGVTAAVPTPEDGFDLEMLGQVFTRWSQAAEMTEYICAEIGALALASRTVDQATWVAATGGSIGFSAWPDTALRICAVDTASGTFVPHSRETGAPLDRAIASSCAIPGMFPPVEIGGRRYMDGGVRSCTNADCSVDIVPDIVLVVAPISSRTAVLGPMAERCLQAETAELEDRGAQVIVVLPDDADVLAFGPNLMDPTRVDAARDSGYRRGRALARGAAGIWNP